MFRSIAVAGLFLAFAASADAEMPADYRGPFPTSALYEMCSKSDQPSREKCRMYLQGLMAGIRLQRQVAGQRMPVCLPSDITSDKARRIITRFIDESTGGRPTTRTRAIGWPSWRSPQVISATRGRDDSDIVAAGSERPIT
jgi:Ssp1 endopeptidase immunity protein Rap1a